MYIIEQNKKVNKETNDRRTMEPFISYLIMGIGIGIIFIIIVLIIVLKLIKNSNDIIKKERKELLSDVKKFVKK